MPTSNRLFTALVLVLAASSAACSSFGSDPAASPDPASMPGRDDAGGGDDAAPPKAPVVTGTPDPSELTESFGVFVTTNGKANGVGTRKDPVATIQQGIDLGKSLGKRVYVCAGTFHEALVVADSISIIGGLDCSREVWRTGTARTRVEAPASPAVTAKDISSPTRLEALDIVAPNASEPSASSIGLQAVRAPGLTIAASKIAAGSGADGSDGTDGVQLVEQGSPNGGGLPAAKCDNGTCKSFGIDPNITWTANVAAGGTSVCAGAAGKNGLPGGYGGAGALWKAFYQSPVTLGWATYAGSFYGESKSGAAGAPGADAPAGDALGTFSEGGYAPANGAAGTDGMPGNGGRGGRGSDDYGLPAASSVSYRDVWRTASGDGGGAGGCPGLAGAPGTGGGASIAVALVESPIVIDSTELLTGRAGTGGRGAFGSDPTPGGNPGVSWSADPIFTGRHGGRGGVPGISTNGSNGPSLGIAHFGGAPTRTGNTKITLGQGGSAIDSRSRADGASGSRTIPSTPAGLSEEMHSF